MNKIIKNYAHDYRDMKMSEEELVKMLNEMIPEIFEVKMDKITTFINCSYECCGMLIGEIDKKSKSVNFKCNECGRYVGFINLKEWFKIDNKEVPWDNADLREIELFNMSKEDLIKIILDKR